MKFGSLKFSLVSALLVSCAVTFAQPSFDVGDWTSYKDFRYARSLDLGLNELFVATSGGILEYHILRKQWYDPWVVGYGMSEPVTLDDPMLLLYDQQTAYLWVATRTQLLQYDVNIERWRIVERNLWGPLDRVVNLGTGGNSIYVETIPENIFRDLFTYGSPIPNPAWYNFITRYKGSNTFGGFMIDTGNDEPRDVHWRGLRSRVPLIERDLFGAPGLPPLNFPSLILPPGYVLHSDGTILDPALRGAPITDWIVDRYGNLFATHWGTGVLQADLRTSRAILHMYGPAGNDIHSLIVSDDAIWMGGFNSGDRTGISRASRDLLGWNFFEMRDDAHIRSTSVYDFADWDGGIWIATENGLTSFNKRKADWTHYSTPQNLQSEQIRALAATDTELWIGSARGLAVMTAPGHEIWRISSGALELNGVTRLALFRDTLFVATPSGLFKGQVGRREFGFMPLDPKFLNAPVLDLSVTASEVWLITAEGVMRYDPIQGESKSWYAVDWLQGAEPSCILAMPEFVWVGTRENGFYRFHKETGEWIHYSTRDGLVDDHVQTIRADGDDLLIGTANGLTRFYWNRPGRAK